MQKADGGNSNPRALKLRTGIRLEQIDQFIHGQFDVAEDGAQQARAERFARVYGDGSRPTVSVLEKNMTAAGPINRKAGLFKGADNLSSLGAGKTRHTQIC